MIIGFLCLSLGGAKRALAGHLTCPSDIPKERKTWCDDASSDRFFGGICLAEPEAKNRAVTDDPSETDEIDEVADSAVCVLGEVKTAEIENLADFTISAEFLPANQFEALLEIDPSLSDLEIESLSNDQGEFQATLLLSRQGQYNIKVQARFIHGDLLEDGRVIKRILRISSPHVTVSNARPGGGNADLTVTEEPVIPGDPSAPGHAVSVTSPAGGLAAESIDFCLSSSHREDDPLHPIHTGEEIEVTARNRITDDSSGQTKIMTITCSPGDGICKTLGGGGSAGFCDGGTIVNIPMGHGTNEIEIEVANAAGGERIAIDPIENDLRGPQFCVSYLDEEGNTIDDVDGKVLLPGEAEKVTVDVTLGACGGMPETVAASSVDSCDPKGPPDCGNAPVCITSEHLDRTISSSSPAGSSLVRGTDGRLSFEAYDWIRKFFGKSGQEASETGGTRAMCAEDSGGVQHYRAQLSKLRFPINTFTLQAIDNAGNKTIETHSFSFGEVRPLFNAGGVFDLAGAMVPKGVGGFIPAGMITGELKQILLHVLNTDKFKNDILVKLLDPRQPGEEEIACLQDLSTKLPCSYDHLASDQRVVAIKPFLGGGDGFHVDAIKIPSLYLLNNNEIQLQLKLEGFEGRAEMYTLQFVDSDDDGEVDTEDDDDDGDGIKDSDEEDDDGDGIPDERDLPGRLTDDPDYGVQTLPIKFAMKELALNLSVRLLKDEHGRLKVEIAQSPGRELVEAIAVDDLFIEFNCEKETSELYEDGVHPPVDTDACNGLKSLNDRLRRVNSLSSSLIDTKKRQFQGTNQQLLCTLNAIARCSTPKRAEVLLDKFETEKVMAIAPELFDKKFHLDFFAPLRSSDLAVDTSGVGFSGKGVLLPAGVTAADDDAERNAEDFLNKLPDEFRTHKFGPVFEKEVPPEDQVSPTEAAREVEGEFSLALKEETINSLLHAVNLLLFDLDRQEPDDLKTLDLFAKRLREEFGGGIPDIGGLPCRNENDQVLDGDSTFKCFPFALSIDTLFGQNTFGYKDFDGSGKVDAAIDSQIPVLIRTALNNFWAPTVKLVSGSVLEAWDGDSPTRPKYILAELEIGLPPTTMTIFEEQFREVTLTDPATGDPVTTRRGTGIIKDWCDSDRFPGVDPARCTEDKRAPIASFLATGRIFLTLAIDRFDNGILRVHAGVSSIEGDKGPDLDTEKSYLKVTTVENNTIVRDSVLADAFEANLKIVLGKFLFGSPRAIELKIPAMVPLKDFCARFPEEDRKLCECVADPDGPDCDAISAIEDLWNDLDLDEDFGIYGFELQDPLAALVGSPGSPRYLSVGIGACIKDSSGDCIGTNPRGRHRFLEEVKRNFLQFWPKNK